MLHYPTYVITTYSRDDKDAAINVQSVRGAIAALNVWRSITRSGRYATLHDDTGALIMHNMPRTYGPI